MSLGIPLKMELGRYLGHLLIHKGSTSQQGDGSLPRPSTDSQGEEYQSTRGCYKQGEKEVGGIEGCSSFKGRETYTC